jgi:hypothetical protein
MTDLVHRRQQIRRPEWSEALRRQRNPGAHSFDAKDLLMFTEAICDHVFVLHARFGEYSKRQGSGDSTA